MDSAMNFVGCISESRKAFASNHSFWDSAPEELIARIIALLPYSSIYWAQGVCRRWRSIIWSPLFISLCKQWSRPRKPWLLEFQEQMYNQAWAFDLDGWQWFHLDFFFLPENAIILAASRGLVCLGRSSREGHILYVCNPVTKKWRQLPTIPFNPCLVLLDVDHESSTYTVAALSLRSENCNTRPSGSVLIFDSKTGDWKETVGLPEDLHYRSLWDASLCGTLLVCLTMCKRIQMFDIVKAEWTQNPASSHLPTDADLPLYICNNKAGSWCVVSPYRGLAGMSVYRYDVSARRWRTSSHSYSIVCAGRFSSLCSGTSIGGLEEYVLQTKRRTCFSSTSGSFSCLPKSPLTQRKIEGKDIFISAVWFEPHMEATT